MKCRPVEQSPIIAPRLSREFPFKLVHGWKPLWCGWLAVLLILVALDGSITTPLRAASPAQAGVPSGQQAPTATPKRIAVLDFDDSMVQNDVQGVFGFKADVGRGFAGLLVRDLIKDGSYSVVDAKTIDKVWDEQKFSRSDRADRESAVKIGKILGVDGVVIGTVTRFGGTARKIGDENWIPRTRRATVEAEAHLVNVATDEIVAVAMGDGEASSKDASLLAGWHGSADPDVDFGSGDFQHTLMGQALNASVAQAAAQLASDRTRLSSAR